MTPPMTIFTTGGQNYDEENEVNCENVNNWEDSA